MCVQVVAPILAFEGIFADAVGLCSLLAATHLDHPQSKTSCNAQDTEYAPLPLKIDDVFTKGGMVRSLLMVRSFA